ncbi:MAG: radical SAM protein [bacterium]|nr:radical SAM protein [bacterium]
MRPQQKIISWNICRGCNYNCRYCAQGKEHSGFPATREITALGDFFCGLDAGWEIKISGGEPFLYPGFLTLIKRLVKAGIKISVVTNFSFPKKDYKRFIKSTGKQLRTFSVSLHREKVHWKEFLKKTEWIAKKIARTAGGSLVVNTVVEPGKAAELIAIKREFEAKGIRFYPQLMRKKGKTVEYKPVEKEIILTLAGDKNPFEINAGYSMKGRTCYAGMNYFIVSPEGKCFTCYPGKRDGAGYMGEIPAGDFKYRDEPTICPYEVCPCTVPINRGMII